MHIDPPMRRAVWRTGHWLCALWLMGCSQNDKTPTRAAQADLDKPSAELPEAEAPAIHAAANDASIHTPTDATPSPDGTRVYYTAFSQNAAGEQSAGVFSVAADGGGPISMLALGAPLLSPVGITSSLDGKQLFIADSAAGADGGGALLSLSADGGPASILAGSEGYRPAGLTVAKQGEVESLYFSGRTPDTGVAGLYRTTLSGGAPESVANGAPFEDPSGVVLAANGDAYVVDNASDTHAARVLRVRGGQVSAFVENIGVGFPGGITLTHDDGTLLVSGLDPQTKHDVVYFAATATGKLSRLTKTVGQFAEPAGLHRAHDANVFAWADSEANASGTVYVLQP
jgi:sugar lactone lactonase YvrE